MAVHSESALQGLKAAEEDAQFLYWQTLGSQSLRAWRSEVSKRQHLQCLHDLCATRHTSRKARHSLQFWRAWAARQRHLRLTEGRLCDLRRKQLLADAFQVWRARVRHLQQQIHAVVHASRLYLSKAFRVWRRSANKAAAVCRAVGLSELTLRMAAMAQADGVGVAEAFRSWRSMVQVCDIAMHCLRPEGTNGVREARKCLQRAELLASSHLYVRAFWKLSCMRAQI
jgi:hypothetical protein